MIRSWEWSTRQDSCPYKRDSRELSTACNSEKVPSPQNLALLAPWFPTPNLQNHEHISAVYKLCSIYGTSLEQPKGLKIATSGGFNCYIQEQNMSFHWRPVILITNKYWGSTFLFIWKTETWRQKSAFPSSLTAYNRQNWAWMKPGTRFSTRVVRTHPPEPSSAVYQDMYLQEVTTRSGAQTLTQGFQDRKQHDCYANIYSQGLIWVRNCARNWHGCPGPLGCIV